MKVVLLAAGRGRRFGKRTARLPKCLVPIGGGQTLLSRYLDSFRALGLRDIVLVVGHEKEKIVRECVEKGRGLSIKFLVNPDYKKGSVVSLFTAAAELSENCLIMDADVYFRTSQLKTLLGAARSSFLVDPLSKSTGEEMMLMAAGGRLVRVSKKTAKRLKIIGEATGFLKLTGPDGAALARILEKTVRSGRTGVEYEECYNELMKKRRLGFRKIAGFWTEMDFEEDLSVIRKKQGV